MLNLHSLKSTRLKVEIGSPIVARTWATGFIYLQSSRPFLITNRHVLTGSSVFDGKLIWQGFPTKITGKLHIRNDSTSEIMPREFSISWNVDECPFALGLARGFENSNLVEHDPMKRYKWLDIAVIDLFKHGNVCTEGDYSLSGYTMEDTYPSDIEDARRAIIEMSVTSSGFIAGYPLPFEQTHRDFPIFKHATIASEPHDNEVDYFYIDSRSKSGMSGSPFLGDPGLTLGQDGKLTTKCRKLMGVYSGRRGVCEEILGEVELGLVWRMAPILDQLIVD